MWRLVTGGVWFGGLGRVEFDTVNCCHLVCVVCSCGAYMVVHKRAHAGANSTSFGFAVKFYTMLSRAIYHIVKRLWRGDIRR